MEKILSGQFQFAVFILFHNQFPFPLQQCGSVFILRESLPQVWVWVFLHHRISKLKEFNYQKQFTLLSNINSFEALLGGRSFNKNTFMSMFLRQTSCFCSNAWCMLLSSGCVSDWVLLWDDRQQLVCLWWWWKHEAAPAMSSPPRLTQTQSHGLLMTAMHDIGIL